MGDNTCGPIFNNSDCKLTNNNKHKAVTAICDTIHNNIPSIIHGQVPLHIFRKTLIHKPISPLNNISNLFYLCFVDIDVFCHYYYYILC